MVVATWAACASAPSDRPPEPQGIADAWVSVIAADPAAFEGLVGPNRDGWAALHRHDAEAAWAQLPAGDARTRAAMAAATYHDDEARLQTKVHSELWTRWTARGAEGSAAPPPPEAAWLLGWATDCAHPPPEAIAAARALDEALERGDAAAAALASRLPPDTARGAFVPCAADAERRLWEGRALAGAATWSTLPLGEGLAASFLSAWPTAAALRAGLTAGRPPGRVSLADDDPARVPPGTTADEARDGVAAWTALLDALAARVVDQAPTEGAALVAELGLIGRWREQVALANAREALADGHPQAAAVWVRAVEHPLTGLAADPSVPVLLAEAELASGHVREALTALHGATHPVPGTAEPLADLAVLEGIGRTGDSKEDP